MTTKAKQPSIGKQKTAGQSSSPLDKAFQGEFRKGSAETASILQILGKTALAMLLPLAYVAVLGAVAYFTFYHALFGLHFNQGAPFHIAAVLYVLPLLSGICFITLMLRPFFHLPAPDDHKIDLHENDSAELLQLVTLIQKKIGNTQTINIELSMLPVVSTKVGARGFKQRNNLTLVVGLPLIKSMTVQQLSGLICHELAHHSQRHYRNAYKWTTSVDAWFDDCLQGRDGWKAYFTDLEESGSNSAYVVAGLLGKSAIIASDAVLGQLHKVFRTLSSTTLKKLDRDADQSAVLLSGSLGVSEALEQLKVTSKAWQLCQFRLLNPRSLTLADNFVDSISVCTDVEDDQELVSLAPYLPSSWSYHQDIDERIDFAKHEDVVGLLNLTTPAADMFKQFSALCKTVTPLYYRECGIQFSLKSLKPVASNLKLQAAEDGYRKAIEDYTSMSFSPAVVWDTNTTSMMAKMQLSEKCNLLNETIGQFRNQLPTFQDAHVHHSNTQKEVLAYHLAQLRLKHGYTTDAQIGHLVKAYQAQKLKYTNQMSSFDNYSQCIGRRLSAAVLLDTRKSVVTKTLPLLTNLQQLYLIQKHIKKGHQLTHLIGGITAVFTTNQETKLKPELDAYTQKLAGINRYIFSTLSRLPGDLKGVPTISGYLQEQMKLKLLPGRDDASKAQDLFALLEDEFSSLNTIVTGQLVEFAMKNELANTISPVRLVVKPTLDKSA